MLGEAKHKTSNLQSLVSRFIGSPLSRVWGLVPIRRSLPPSNRRKRAQSIRELAGTLDQIAGSFKMVATYSNALANFIPCGLIACDSEGAVTAFNRAAEKLLQVEPDDFLGRRIPYGEVPRTSPTVSRILEMIHVTLLSGHEYSGEELGDSPKLSVTTRGVRDFRNRLQGVVATISDISETKRLRELLYAAERLASFGEIAAGMTHELRSPLTSIKGLAQVIELGTLDRDKERQFARTITAEIDRLETLLSQLLDWGKPFSTKLDRCSIEEVVEEVILLIGPSARLTGIELTHEVEGTPRQVMIDRKAIKQALLNIVVNAIQAMPGGGGISILTREEGGRVRVDIRDTGPGIDNDTLPRIFEPFFTTREKGTGLGLSIAREIIRDHGGEIQVRSRIGEGTHFTIFLPVAV